MQEKLLKKIIADYAGQDAEKIVDLLYAKQNVNEFLIAKKLNLTINQTRNMLYKLADEGLVQFIRKKDKKKGGWYTYFWTLKTKRSLLKYKEKIIEETHSLKNQVTSMEKERHFYCPNCDISYNEETALLDDYTCPECGETLQIKDTVNSTEQFKNEIKKLQNTLAQIEKEIADIEVKEEKAKGRRLKLEKKKKDEERRKRKVERDKEKAKTAKIAGKVKQKVQKANKKPAKKPKKKSFLKKALKKFSKKRL